MALVANYPMKLKQQSVSNVVIYINMIIIVYFFNLTF